MQVNNLCSHCFFSIGGTYFYMSKILRFVKHAAASFASLLVQLFQMVLLKLGYEFKGTFSVVFLGLHRKPDCVCWVYFFLVDFIFGTMMFFFYSLLTGSYLYHFFFLSVVLPISYFPPVFEQDSHMRSVLQLRFTC